MKSVFMFCISEEKFSYYNQIITRNYVFAGLKTFERLRQAQNYCLMSQHSHIYKCHFEFLLDLVWGSYFQFWWNVYSHTQSLIFEICAQMRFILNMAPLRLFLCIFTTICTVEKFFHTSSRKMLESNYFIIYWAAIEIRYDKINRKKCHFLSKNGGLQTEYTVFGVSLKQMWIF